MKQPIPFGKYLLLERINVGGMAEIFLARSRGVQGFKRLLAIKKILPTMAEDEEFIAMFVDEARIAAELSHACIVQIFELGRYEDDYYIAMEFVHGKDLRYIQERKSRERRPMPVELAAFIAHRICEALDYAHNKKDPSGRPLGIIHRDVSPQNVIISYEGEVKICDFGIAKAANRSQKTQAGVLKGKFGYMSPEQVRGLPLDGRSDLFTVGTLLYEMVTLERLFVGESDFSTLEKVRNADVVPPSTYNREVPDELEDIILRALAKEVEDRYQSATEFGDALQAFMINHKLVSSRDLATFVRSSYTSEYEAELQRLEEYQNLPESAAMGSTGSAVRARLDERTADEIEDEAAELDMDAKTLIFASAPPPIPGYQPAAGGAAEASEAPWNRAQRGEGDAGAELADAKTMIFADPEIQPDANIHELPTRGLMERPQLEIIEGGEPPTPRERPSRSLRERLFVPLVLFAALLLGWSVFVTLQLRQKTATSLPPPSFELVTRPATGVKVELDQREVTTVTPYTLDTLEPGTHHLRIRRNGFEEIDRTFQARPGTHFLMEVVLTERAHGGDATATRPGGDQGAGTRPDVQEPDPAGSGKEIEPPPTTLAIASRPPGARVFIDGDRIGDTPIETSKIEPGKKVRVVVALRGHRKVIRQVEVEPGKQNKLDVSLVRIRAPDRGPRKPPPAKAEHGYLVANTRPWSKVYVDGKYTGRETPIAPDKRLKLTAGKHRVVFETPGGKRHGFDVVIEPDKVLKLIKRLE